MGRLTDIPEELQALIDRELDAFFAFTLDAFADPSLLTQVPDGSEIQAVRIADREPGRHYDIETPRTVASVLPKAPPQRASRTRPAMPTPLAARRPKRDRKRSTPPTPIKTPRRTGTG